ncbi:MAG: hypothetical protein ABSD59_01170 [Terracidiphilus sp.]
MPFDRKLVEAKLALSRISSVEMPSLAWDVLEAGLDGPCIRKLAALDHPSGWETDQVLPGFMAEAGLERISCTEASIRLARQLAGRILAEGLDPLAHTRDFELLWIQAGYPRAIYDAGTLDDQKYVAESMGQTEAEIREHVQSVLIALTVEA